MQEIGIYINDEALDISTNTQVAINKQVMLLGDISARQLDFTPRFKIPATGKNRRLLDRVNTPGNTSLRPYISAPCTLLVNGMPLVADGRILLSGTDNRREYECIILSGNETIFGALEGKKLRDLNFLYEEFQFTEAEYLARRGHNKDTPGLKIFFPIIDSGVGLIPGGGSANAYGFIDCRYQVPALSVYHIIEKMLEDAGLADAWTNTSFFSTDALFQRLALLFVRPGSSDAFFEFTGIGQQDGDLSHNTYSDTTDLFFGNDIVQDVNGVLEVVGFPPGTNSHLKFTAPFTGTFKITLNLRPSFSKDGSEDTTIDFGYLANGTDEFIIRSDFWPDSTWSATSKLIHYTSVHSIFLEEGDTAEFFFRISQDSGGGVRQTIIELFDTFTQQITIEVGEFLSFYNSYINPALMLPDVTQADFLKGVLKLFGLVPQYKNGSPYFATIQDILTRSFGVLDWSDKLNFESQERYSIGNNYGQKSYFKYKYNDEDLPPFADYKQVIENENYPDEKNVIESIFTASKEGEETVSLNTSGPGGSGGDGEVTTLLKIPYYSAGDSSDYVLTDNNEIRVIDTEVVSRWSMSGGQDFYFGKFRNLYWSNLVAEYYEALMRIIERPVTKMLSIKMSLRDVVQLDHFKLYYFKQYQAVFYLQKVQNFFSGAKTVMCEFIEAPATVQNLCPNPSILNVIGFFAINPSRGGFVIKLDTANDYYIQNYIISVTGPGGVVYLDNFESEGGDIVVNTSVTGDYTYNITAECGNGEKPAITGTISFTPWTVTSWD